MPTKSSKTVPKTKHDRRKEADRTHGQALYQKRIAIDRILERRRERSQDSEQL